MEINIRFISLEDLQEFVDWAGKRNELTAEVIARSLRSPMANAAPDKPDLRGPDTRPVTAEGAVIPTGDGQSEHEAASATAGEAPKTDPAPETAPKRKRRTKAEIAADEAAAKAVLQAEAERESGVVFNNPLDNLKPEPEPNGLTPSPEIVALAATIDGTDKMAHMNEGRDFIAKHGFPKYNETFALADVSTNIAAHTPEQAAMHRAAMQWLIAQGSAK